MGELQKKVLVYSVGRIDEMKWLRQDFPSEGEKRVRAQRREILSSRSCYVPGLVLSTFTRVVSLP